MILAMLACREPAATTDGGTTSQPTDSTPTGGATGETGTPGTTTGPATAECDATANPQVFRCTVTLPSPGPATLTVTASGAPTRTFSSTESTSEHVFDAWGLYPSTTYGWSSQGVTGEFTTGDLPADLEDADVTVTGALFGLDAVLIYLKCDYFVMVDSDGVIVWYVPTTLYDGLPDGMRWSQASKTLIAVTDSTMSFDTSELGEVDLEWNQVTHLTPADFDLDLTHDVDRWGDYLYLLGENGSGVGGFEVFEGTTKIGQWLLSDGFPTTPNLGTAHVNGLSVSDDGLAIVSSFTFSDVMAVDADPSSSTFLQMKWHASGGLGTLPTPTYVPAGPDGFRNQHNASLHDGDELWVFDNESQPTSRAVRLQLDAASGTYSELDAWSTGEHCPNQGGSQPVDGGALVTCANTDRVSEFRDGATTPDWTLYATCGGSFGGGSSTRAYGVTVE